ncbi:MAG: hypothetical protein QOH05_3617, partial [Acetobacteraceae bacterium]|nr:hypothetical protein [Acetobacteraceae bacterium]
MKNSADEHAEATTGALMRRSMLRRAGFGSAMGLLGVGALGGGLLAGARPAGAAETDPFPGRPRWRFVFVNHVTT